MASCRLPSAVGLHGGGVPLDLEHATVDRVGAQPGHRLGEGPGDRHLGHAEGGEDGTRAQSVALARLHEGGHGRRVDRLGAVQGDPQAGQVELVAPLERASREDVGEVRSGGGGPAVPGHPLHPASRARP